MEEVWKPIYGFEGMYDISNFGRLYSYPRNTTKGGYTYGNDSGKGYLHKNLWKNGKGTLKGMHKWVWLTFVGPIPEGYDVHHKDHNKHNNFVYVNEDGSVDLEKSNLELVPHNKHYIEHIEDIKNANCKPVLQYTLDGEFVAEYPSLTEAGKQIGISNNHICNCCNNKPHYKTAGGYIWKYKEVA